MYRTWAREAPRAARACLLIGLATTMSACLGGSERAGGDPAGPPAARNAGPAAGAHRAFTDEAKIFVVSAAGGRASALTGSAHATVAEAGDERHGEGGDDAHEEIQVDNPIWSPDGSRLAFTRTSCEYCAPELFVMTPDGSRQERLANVDNAFQPTWSPSGRRLAFLLPGVEGGIYSLRVPAGRPRLVMREAAAIEAPAWSPDGGRIAFARQREPTNWDLYAIGASGRGLRQLTRAAAQETTPAWSPDGRRIAYARQLAGGNWAIEVMNEKGSWRRRVTPRRVSAVEPTWSPDGRRIAFTLQPRHDRSAVAVVNVAGGRIRRLTDESLFATQPDWSPTGRTIAFAARELVGGSRN